MDIKKALAKGLQAELINRGLPLAQEEVINPEPATIEFYEVDWLNTQARVAYPHRPARYFNIRLSEIL